MSWIVIPDIRNRHRGRLRYGFPPHGVPPVFTLNYRLAFAFLLLGSITMTPRILPAAEEQLPNIVFILTDNQGAWDAGLLRQ